MVDVHCRQIIFGGSPDDSYARLLGDYKQDDSARKRVLLLEGPPFAREMATIKDSFRTIRLTEIFRSQKLQKLSSPIGKPPSQSLSSDMRLNYADVTAKLPATSLPSANPIKTIRSTLFGDVHRNALGQRVDVPLPKYHRETFLDLKSRRLCNAFYLMKDCPYESTVGTCTHDHKAKLSAEQLSALAAVARHSPCYRGLRCSNSFCYNGHQCPRVNCDVLTCRFSQEMHKVDVRLVDS